MSKTMQETKSNNGSNEDSCRKKERHIVTWTQQEDDILRQQISLHGTENWAIIASKFKDKTTRQCRRRWYTYLNSDFKKGGWSPEEDLLLCEAQRVFGNRWTEIAKVVSGRTDNAVKNRFSTLCKKRAKCEALAKEKKSTYINSNNKRVIFHSGFSVDGTPETALPVKKIRRPHITDHEEYCCFGDRSHLGSGDQQHRPPLEVLAQNFHDVNMADQYPVSNAVKVPVDVLAAQNSNNQGTILKKDDPKITALMQHAEFLSSLAWKVNSENTDQNVENAWKVVQDFLNQSKKNDILEYRISDIDFQLEEFKDMIEDLRNSNNGSQPSWEQPEPYQESSANSEYSTGSTRSLFRAPDKTEHSHDTVVALQEEIETELLSVPTEEQDSVVECGTSTNLEEIFPPCIEKTNREISVSASSTTEFSPPLQVTPLFRSLAAGIPSPKFSESERNFLLKTLGVESPCSNPTVQPPLCKRALLQSL